jgi:hypothetical protein
MCFNLKGVRHCERSEAIHTGFSITIDYVELAFAKSAAMKQSILGRLSLLYLIIFAFHKICLET